MLPTGEEVKVLSQQHQVQLSVHDSAMSAVSHAGHSVVMHLCLHSRLWLLYCEHSIEFGTDDGYCDHHSLQALLQCILRYTALMVDGHTSQAYAVKIRESAADLHMLMQADLAELSKEVSALRTELSCQSERTKEAQQQAQALQRQLADTQTANTSLKAELTAATATLHHHHQVLLPVLLLQPVFVQCCRHAFVTSAESFLSFRLPIVLFETSSVVLFTKLQAASASESEIGVANCSV